jgi:NAD(P)-dependent dehydrogenase (short-subunit alcohol dehydrogenase family)
VSGLGRLDGKVALVTGAGSIGPGWGNGKAAAVLYAREGARVLALDVNPQAAEETRDIIREEGGQCEAVTADASRAEDVKSAVGRCLAHYGRVDVLHNNVGIVQVGGPVEIEEDEWDRLIAVNLKSVYLACKFCIPHMLEQGGGAIVNVSSVASVRYTGYPSASYNASKGAINQLTQNIAVQYADRGIRANCVLPGLMDTPQIRAYVTSGYGGGVEEMLRKRNETCPMRRMGTAWDVAFASLFLASDEARYITGAQLVVDGGLSCKMS